MNLNGAPVIVGKYTGSSRMLCKMLFQNPPELLRILCLNPRQPAFTVRFGLLQRFQKSFVFAVSFSSHKKIRLAAKLLKVMRHLASRLYMVHIHTVHPAGLPRNSHRRHIQLLHFLLKSLRIFFHRYQDQAVYPVAPHDIQTFLFPVPVII